MIMAGVFEVRIETHFCAAHALRGENGASEPTHGHNFRAIVTVATRKLNREGTAIDFLKLQPLLEAETGRLGQGFINETVEEFRADGGGLSPSAENIAWVLFQRLRERLPKAVHMRSVEVFEAPGCSATYRE